MSAYSELVLAHGATTYWTGSGLTDLSGGIALTVVGTVNTARGVLPDDEFNSRAFGKNPANALSAAHGPAALDVGDVFTVEAWFISYTIPSASEFPTVVTKFTGTPQIYFAGDIGKIALGSDGVGEAARSLTSPAANTLYHVCATHNGTTNTKLYLNGVDDTGTVTSRTFTNSTTALNIGRIPSVDLPWHGLIGHVALYKNVVSTAAEVAARYSTGIARRTQAYAKRPRMPLRVAA